MTHLFNFDQHRFVLEIHLDSPRRKLDRLGTADHFPVSNPTKALLITMDGEHARLSHLDCEWMFSKSGKIKPCFPRAATDIMCSCI